MSLPLRLGALSAGILVVAASGAGIAAVASHGSSPASPAHAAGLSARSIADTGSARTVYGTAKDAVAYITADTSAGQATGSGFLVSDDGRIVTNEHVVDGATQVTVKLGVDGTAQPAQVVAADASKDLAILKIGDTHGVKPLQLGDSSKLQVGDTVYAIGNPYGLDHTFTSGIVSALNREIQAPDGTPITGAIQTDAAINPGNSGGALLDSEGRVVGVNSQIASNGSSEGTAGNVGIGFAIASATVKGYLDHPTSSSGSVQGQQVQPDQQRDPYGQQDPNGQQDPYGQQGVDPWAQPDQQQDPYGQQGVDPWSQPASPDGGGVLVLPMG